MNEAVKSLLLQIRQHPSFPAFLREVEEPLMKQYKPKTDDPEKARLAWVFSSGEKAQHEKWLFFLTGDTNLREKE